MTFFTSRSDLHFRMQSPQQTTGQIPPQVSEALARGGVVLCANARSARALSGLYGEQVATLQGRHAWETPRILDWTQWLHEQWKLLLLTGAEARMLLSPLQEEVLWKEIVQPTVEKRSLISPGDVARLCVSAYSLLLEYKNDSAADSHLQRGGWDHPALEPEMFRRWALEMERRCTRNHWLCEANLPWAIGQAIHNGRLPIPAAVAWNGFDRLTPADESFRNILEQAGCTQQDVAWNMQAEERVVAAPGQPDELEACAEWARRQLEHYPANRLAILLPDVQASRAAVDRVLRRVLMPDADGLTEQEPRPVYEFTLGLPLAQVPVVRAALMLLQWCVLPLEQEAITWIVTTGFFGRDSRAADATSLARADKEMRKKLTVPELDMKDALVRLSNFTSSSGGNYSVTQWVKRMQRALEALQKRSGKKTCPQWVSTISDMLKKAGWPGARAADSIGFQVQDRWQRALDEISALNLQDRRYEYLDFLDLFRAHLGASIFSPESTGAPVTVTGMLESAGRSFDAVWVLGATDVAWPAPSNMHPLLPAWLQMELRMPGSSAEHNERIALSVLERLRSSTGELVFSYAKEGTEGAQRPSSLIAKLRTEQIAEISVESPFLVEPFADEMVVPWPGGRAGGQDVIRSQSACPFQAFASRRLGANPLPSLEAGLNAAERGTLVHNVLQSVWGDPRMRDSGHLLAAIFAGELTAMVHEHVAKAFDSYERAASTEWEHTYLRLELERACAAIEQWLRYESRRKPFEVLKTEEKQTIFIEGLELSVRMDRIDKVADGQVLIDYKTGKLKTDAWDGERLAEPQLPIYAVSGNVEGLVDVMFAQVRLDEDKYLSAVYESAPDIFPFNPSVQDAATIFQEKCAQWIEALGSLSRDFQAGIATVTPKHFPKTCKHCHYQGLCRVAESSQAASIAEEDEASA